VGPIQRGALAFGEAGPAGAAVEQPILPVLAEAAGEGEISGTAASGVGTIGILATEPREVVHGVMRELERAARKRIETPLTF
jgi:hypothetical protein